MKLVDILARELKDWPESFGFYCVAGGGPEVSWGAWFNERMPERRDDGWYDVGCVELWLSKEPSDHLVSVVTRAEWQAAVDALNAPKVVEWDGVGNPPVGVDIECTFDSWGYWRKGRVLYYGKQMIFMEQDGESPDGRKFEGSMNPDGIKFRPVRTAEQVAAEERDAKAKELYLTINWNDAGSTWDSLAASRKADYLKAIDAGYRKEPKPCGS